MKVFGTQVVTGIVLTTMTTKNNKGMVTMQLMGADPQNVFVKAEELGRYQVGTAHELDVTIKKFGEGESQRQKDGKTYTDRFPTYRLDVWLHREDNSEIPQTRPKAA